MSASPRHDPAAVLRGADALLVNCGNVRSNETVLIICDHRTAELGTLVANRATELAAAVTNVVIPAVGMHGVEPPEEVAAMMRASHLVLGMTTMSMAHTRARNTACAAGARYLSLPDYSYSLMCDPCLLIDYRARAPIVRRVSDAFSRGTAVRVMTAAGTDIRLQIGGRQGNYCPGFVEKPGELGSPPDIEANVSPVETESEGVVVVDGSIPCREIGLLSSPIRLHVHKGAIIEIEGAPSTKKALEALFQAAGSPKARILAECGVGLNDAARLTGCMLTDEGAAGCMHFGFGSNSTVGGTNDVPFHLDFVFQNATLEIDGHRVIAEGVLV